MDYADLVVGLVVDRRVLDFRLGDSAELSERTLGSEYVDDVHRRRRFLRRDFGLLELTFTGASWVCTTLSLQFHRLSGEQAVNVPSALVSEFGRPPRYVDLDEFRSRLTGRGVSLAEVGHEDEHGRYTVDEMNCEVITSYRSEGGVETLWSVSIW